MQYVRSSKNYQHIFHFDGIGLLHGYIWTKSYLKLEAMVTAIEDDCYYWLPKTSIKKSLREGISLFSNNNLFGNHKKEFEYLLKSLPADYKKNILKPRVVKEDDVRDFLNKLSRCHTCFFKTEFFFVDEAFKLSKSNKSIEDNLKVNYSLKERGRVEWINKVYLGDSAYIKILCAKLARKFKVKAEDLLQYTEEEILSLYAGEIVSQEEINRRKTARIVFALNGKIYIYSGQKVRAEVQEILKERVDSNLPMGNTLKGIAVSGGKITGRIRVIVSDGKTYSSLNAQIKKMKKGDILVAETTSPEFMPACRKASAIITNQGGLLSHAAVISREFGIPAIVGLKIATKVLKDGDLVEVDADNGIVRILNK